MLYSSGSLLYCYGRLHILSRSVCDQSKKLFAYYVRSRDCPKKELYSLNDDDDSGGPLCFHQECQCVQQLIAPNPPHRHRHRHRCQQSFYGQLSQQNVSQLPMQALCICTTLQSQSMSMSMSTTTFRYDTITYAGPLSYIVCTAIWVVSVQRQKLLTLICAISTSRVGAWGDSIARYSFSYFTYHKYRRR